MVENWAKIAKLAWSYKNRPIWGILYFWKRCIFTYDQYNWEVNQYTLSLCVCGGGGAQWRVQTSKIISFQESSYTLCNQMLWRKHNPAFSHAMMLTTRKQFEIKMYTEPSVICNVMNTTVIWYLSFEFCYCTRASVIDINKKDKYHFAREFNMLTCLWYVKNVNRFELLHSSAMTDFTYCTCIR